jgi:hypothetical protein
MLNNSLNIRISNCVYEKNPNIKLGRGSKKGLKNILKDVRESHKVLEGSRGSQRFYV